METYLKPELELINLNLSDVISTSGEIGCESDCPQKAPGCVLTPIVCPELVG